jgi:hypothetical protein
MGGKSKSPDYAGAAVAQGEANEAVVRDQTYANRPTQVTPWGYTSWDTGQQIDPSSGQSVTTWQQTEGLTPELQDILNKQIAIQGDRTDVAGSLTGRMGQEFGTPMQWDNLSPMGQNVANQFTVPEGTQQSVDFSGAPEIGDPNRIRERAEDAMFSKAQSRLQPKFDSQRQQLEIKMRNQGLGPEDEAWKSQMESLGRQETDAYDQATWGAVGEGRQESGQMFGQDVTRRGVATGEELQQGNFYNQAAQQQFGQNMSANNQNYQQALQGSQYATAIRQQQMAEQMQQRGFSLNEINALLSGQQVQAPQMPSFTGAQAAQPAPIYQGAVDQGNFDQASQQGLMSGVGGLVNAGISAYTGGLFGGS